MTHDKAKALEILNKELKGNFISSFSVGDSWVLCFGYHYLLCQDLLSEDEHILNEWFQNNYPSYDNCVDKENISKSTIVSAHLRKEITRINMDESCSLTIEFENDSRILLPTNIGIVDWQWCFNKSGNDPYHDYEVACFWEGEIAIK